MRLPRQIPFISEGPLILERLNEDGQVFTCVCTLAVVTNRLFPSVSILASRVLY